MGDSKALPIVGGILFFLALPLLIVMAMMFGSMGAMGQEDPCATSEGQGKAFGWPTDEHEPSEGYSDDHKGLDYDVDKGSPVRAAADGEVTSIQGDWIKIKHGEGVETWYQWFESKSVKQDQKVKRGDEIGKSGEGDEDNGESGEHLHFEMHVEQEGGLKPGDPTDSIGDAASGASAACDCGPGGPLSGANNPQKAFNFLVQSGYTTKQAAGVVGNMQVESTSEIDPTVQYPSTPGVSPAQALQNNSQNPPSGRGNAWGIVQWYPASKIIEEARTAKIKDEEIATLGFQLDFLRRQLIGDTDSPEKGAGDHLKSTTTVEEASRSFALKYERFASEPLNAEETASVDKRIGNAQEILRLYEASAPKAGSGTTTPGGCGGDIVSVAFKLSWKDQGHGHTPPEGYADAVAKYNKSKGDAELTDCGVFVATVMLMSGADPDYPPRGTSVQFPYLRNSPKYTSFTSGEPQPGDIFITDGHTYLYVGPFEGKDGRQYNSLAASLRSHTPEPTNYMWADNYGPGGSTRVYTAFRLKDKPATQPTTTGPNKAS